MQHTRLDPRTKSDSDTNAAEPAARPSGIALGRIVSLSDQGVPSVDYVSAPGGQPVAARTLAPLEARHLGQMVALAFEAGRADAPVVLGVIQDPLRDLIALTSQSPAPCARVDGERVVLEAQREIELRCGAASIKLQRDGKILISGTHLLSRSKGPNRIKGGSVQLN